MARRTTPHPAETPSTTTIPPVADDRATLISALAHILAASDLTAAQLHALTARVEGEIRNNAHRTSMGLTS